MPLARRRRHGSTADQDGLDLRRRSGKPLRHDRERPAEWNADLGRTHSRIPDLANGRIHPLDESRGAAVGHAGKVGQHPGTADDSESRERSHEVTLGRVAGIAALAFAAGCGTPHQSALDSAGPQAASIERLFWFFTILLGVIFVIVIGLLLSTLTRRHRAIEQEPLEHSRAPSSATAATPPRTVPA